jgi:RNA-directed DNA polymerase
VVNGLLLGADIRLTRKDMRRWRAFLHRCETQGIEAVSQDIGKNALLVAQGFHSYLHMVNPAIAEELITKHGWIRSSSA